MNQFIEKKINVLRHGILFTVICESRQDIKSFKKLCLKFCPYPIKDFIFIINGTVLNEKNPEAWSQILSSENVYIFIEKFTEKLIRDEFEKEYRMHRFIEKKHQNPKIVTRYYRVYSVRANRDSNQEYY